MSATAGALMRSARTARGLTQRDVAAAAGVTQPRVSALESGVKRVRDGEAARLGPVLGVAAAELTRAPGPEVRARRPPAPRVLTVSSFRDIPAVCPCDWAMAFIGARPDGWDLVKAWPGCPCHGNRSK